MLSLIARPESVEGNRVRVAMTLAADGKSCAKGQGTFIAVSPGHPAYHRW